jgi:hypothetical protein
MAQFYRSFIKKIATIIAPKMTRKTNFFLDRRMLEALGID